MKTNEVLGTREFIRYPSVRVVPVDFQTLFSHREGLSGTVPPISDFRYVARKFTYSGPENGFVECVDGPSGKILVRSSYHLLIPTPTRSVNCCESSSSTWMGRVRSKADDPKGRKQTILKRMKADDPGRKQTIYGSKQTIRGESRRSLVQSRRSFEPKQTIYGSKQTIQVKADDLEG